MQLQANDYIRQDPRPGGGQRRHLSRAIPGDGQWRYLGGAIPVPRRRLSRRLVSQPTDHRKPAGAGGTAHYTVVEVNKRAGEPPDGVYQVARRRTADAPEVKKPVDNSRRGSRRWWRKSSRPRSAGRNCRRSCRTSSASVSPFAISSRLSKRLGDWSGRTKDLDVLTEYVRNAMARAVCKQYVDDQYRLWVITLDPALEDFINGHIERSEHGTSNRNSAAGRPSRSCSGSPRGRAS